MNKFLRNHIDDIICDRIELVYDSLNGNQEFKDLSNSIDKSQIMVDAYYDQLDSNDREKILEHYRMQNKYDRIVQDNTYIQGFLDAYKTFLFLFNTVNTTNI